MLTNAEVEPLGFAVGNQMKKNSEDTKSVGPLNLRLPFDLLKPENIKGCEHFLGYDAKEAQRQKQKGSLIGKKDIK